MKSFLKYIVPIIAFVVIAYAYAPQVLQGKIVDQSDISSWELRLALLCRCAAHALAHGNHRAGRLALKRA